MMRILLADDHALFRAGIASLLQAWGAEVVGHASSGEQAVLMARELRPDLVLMDIDMPNGNGLDATQAITSELADVKVVVVTVSDDDDDLFEAIKAGAQGYLLKDMSEDALSRTLTSVANDEPALSGELAEKILAEFTRLSRKSNVPNPTNRDQLTGREIEVLHLLAQGASNQEIAQGLHVSRNTVGFHVKNILMKLHIKNRTQAAAYAIRSGLVDDGSPALD